MNVSENKKSLYNLAIVKGYFIDKEGLVYNKRRKILSPSLNKSGYKYFMVSCTGGAKKMLVHRLQAYQKYKDDLFKPGIQVRHFNNNKLDNSWNNILLGTSQDNADDKFKKITPDVYITIAKERLDGSSVASLSEKYKIPESTLRNLLNGYVQNGFNTRDEDVINVNSVSRIHKLMVETTKLVKDKFDSQVYKVDLDWTILRISEDEGYTLPVLSVLKME